MLQQHFNKQKSMLGVKHMTHIVAIMVTEFQAKVLFLQELKVSTHLVEKVTAQNLLLKNHDSNKDRIIVMHTVATYLC